MKSELITTLRKEARRRKKEYDHSKTYATEIVWFVAVVGICYLIYVGVTLLEVITM